MDWKDALSALSDTLPAGTPAPAPQPAKGAAPKGRPRIDLERKGRGGKTATILHTFPDSWDDADIERLAQQLKKRLGIGGAYRGREILLQGDVRHKLTPDILTLQ